MRDAESALRKLSRNLHALTAQHEEAVSSHDSAKHAAQMVELDTKKFRIAKAATELEIESERLEGELEMLKERLAELEAQGLEGDEATRREREADDATMWVVLLCFYWRVLTDYATDFASKSTGPWALISRRTRPATSARPLFATVARETSTWSIWTPSSRVFSMPITFGQPCRVELCNLVMAFGFLPG
jgi:hypothetical protein